MRRIPEPELMVDEAQVRAYAQADFSEPHQHMIGLLRERWAGLPDTGTALDFGCGPGDIARRFASEFPGWRVHGIDGSPAMLDFARELTDRARLSDRVSYSEVLLPAPPPAGVSYDLVFSNSLLHHLADPGVFWSALRAWAGPGGRVFVMDLMRPRTRADADELVRRYAADEPELLRTDFFNSLLAAFELDEIDAQLATAALGHLVVEVVSDRHWIAWGEVPTR